jgi:two-component system, NarL family, sensor histidine kinase ComP
LLGEVVSFFIALLLYFRLKNSRSARELSMVFADMGIIFMSLGASIRGDSLGKAAIFMSMLLLPVLFLRFLLVLVDEKSGIRFSYRFVGIYRRIAYGLSFLC